MSVVCSDSCENGITKEKVRTNGSGILPFSRVSRVPKQWAGIFKVSNTCMNLQDHDAEQQ